MAIASVTGAGRGIGQAIAIALARAGFDLVLNDLSEEALAETAAAVVACGRSHALVAGDIGADAARIGDSMAGALGPLHCHVNNAGVPMRQRGDLLEGGADEFDHVMGINLRGTFLLTQAIARRMAGEAASPGTARSIITVTSASAILASPERGAYCISKAGASMMVKLFALRLAEHGIMCHEIRPGVIHTPMTAPVSARYDAMIADGLTPVARWGEVEDVARTVASLATGALPFSTGDAFHVDGGLHLHRL
ncbi:3-ketoacyl-ACP reductase [Bosea sp. 2YAB26]|uniref:3-ketoacyl-ACP reductase n=1 Tax=Bosea sp. 2YAB26 TaxID=3237478 RepID=UPI003F902BF1